MRKFALVSAALPLCLVSSQARAGDSQQWLSTTINVALPDRFKVSDETVVRIGDARGFYELENNLMVGRKLDDKVTVWLGYTFNPIYNHGTFLLREQRFRQQINFDNVVALGPVKLSGQLRLEQRWREGLGGPAWRLRPQIKASMPIVGKTTINLRSEAFLDLNTDRFQKTSGLDRVRTAIWISTPLAKRLAFEIGYLNQHNVLHGQSDTVENALTLGLNGSF